MSGPCTFWGWHVASRAADHSTIPAMPITRPRPPLMSSFNHNYCSEGGYPSATLNRSYMERGNPHDNKSIESVS
ncbi:hypothetical protein J6590_055533 [Homalodisca vitripennis]|nr:hypothetical protein J6590_055533 [Homalodisca vitripennis]